LPSREPSTPGQERDDDAVTTVIFDEKDGKTRLG
jgi:hypothetical protein